MNITPKKTDRAVASIDPLQNLAVVPWRIAITTGSHAPALSEMAQRRYWVVLGPAAPAAAGLGMVTFTAL